MSGPLIVPRVCSPACQGSYHVSTCVPGFYWMSVMAVYVWIVAESGEGDG